MNEADAFDLLRAAVWTTMIGCGPAVLGAMIVGIIVALFQALTQVQEATLTFVPKILVVFVVMALTGSLIGGALAQFTQETWRHIERGF